MRYVMSSCFCQLGYLWWVLMRYNAFYNYLNKWVVEIFSVSVPEACVFTAGTSTISAVHLHDWPVTMYHELHLNVTQSSLWTDANMFLSLSVLYAYFCGTLLCPIGQWANLKCPDWRLTLSIRSTSCLGEPVPRGLKMESSRATPCHLDRVDLGAGLSARTAECIKRSTTRFKYSFQLLRVIYLKKGNFHAIQRSFFPHCFLFILLPLRSGDYLYLFDTLLSADCLILSLCCHIRRQCKWDDWKIGINHFKIPPGFQSCFLSLDTGIVAVKHSTIILHFNSDLSWNLNYIRENFSL